MTILVYFMAIWYFCGYLGTYTFSILVCSTKKKLATLAASFNNDAVVARDFRIG
jgi:hypothetical protein